MVIPNAGYLRRGRGRGGEATSRAQGKPRGMMTRGMVRNQMRVLSSRGGGLMTPAASMPFSGRPAYVGRGTNAPLRSFQGNPSQNSRPGGPGSNVKMVISNLDPGVSDNDIMELFKEFGEVVQAVVHFNSFGKSLQTAHVIYTRYMDAVKASKQYHGVNLDGRPMNIRIEGGPPSLGVPVDSASNVNQRLSMPPSSGFSQNPMGNSAVKRLQNPVGMMRGGFRGGPRGIARGGRGSFSQTSAPSSFNPAGRGFGNRGSFRGGFTRGSFQGRGTFRGRPGFTRGNFQGRGRGRGQKSTPTAAELDAELDAYLSEVNKKKE